MSTGPKYQMSVVQMIRNKCMNRIAYIYSDHFKYHVASSIHDFEPKEEQRDYAVAKALELMNKEIATYKAKVKRLQNSRQQNDKSKTR